MSRRKSPGVLEALTNHLADHSSFSFNWLRKMHRLRSAHNSALKKKGLLGCCWAKEIDFLNTTLHYEHFWFQKRPLK